MIKPDPKEIQKGDIVSMPRIKHGTVWQTDNISGLVLDVRYLTVIQNIRRLSCLVMWDDGGTYWTAMKKLNKISRNE